MNLKKLGARSQSEEARSQKPEARMRRGHEGLAWGLALSSFCARNHVKSAQIRRILASGSWLLASALLLLPPSCRAEILDRIAVTVAKQVVTESDVILDLRVAAFLDQKPVDLSAEQKRKAADRLVEQTLILREADFSRVPLITADDTAHALGQAKSQYPSESEYRAALARYRITESELTSHLQNGLRAMRFTDLRFRPEIHLDDDEVQAFYKSLAEEWKRKNPAQNPTLEGSREEVDRLLTEQRIAQALDRWLGAQRNETRILYRDQVFK